MKLKYRKYTIKNGDTLNGIAQLLGKSTLEIKNFHSMFCADDDHIVLDFPDHLKELFIYPEYRETDLTLIPKVYFDGGDKLLFRPLNQKKEYGVQYTTTTGAESRIMKCEVAVTCKGRITAENYLFEVQRISRFFVDDEETSTIADELAEKVSGVLYPLEISVDETGQWTGVCNFGQIRQRWEGIKEAILDEYEGESVLQYLALSEQTLETESSVYHALTKDWFLNAYFGGIYIGYSHKFNCKKDVNFPLVPYCEAAKYRVTQKIEPYLDEYNLIAIRTSGDLEEERTIGDFENHLDFPYYGLMDPTAKKATGQFAAKYFLNAASNAIESLAVVCTMDLTIPKKVEVIISKM
ncbi:hypothetical protein [Flavobacterium kingsejongi]|uniref:LysM domain-containing protein n=1 Tax=Flavobacterium kingsejongi TaxID=1678728 RepID=A0A2S1LQV7_9FLAO|nr:hypothetical protein [Flavobacterium kingsejongi]AWG26041.1 hypothetical protein FK004_12805 [Flavobacterium kingsejongi]